MGLAACSWTDARPILFNASNRAVQVESRHADGQRLTTLLHPGARVSLGFAGAPVERIEVRPESEDDRRILLSAAQVSACMQEAPRACLGWRLSDDGNVDQLRPGELR